MGGGDGSESACAPLRREGGIARTEVEAKAAALLASARHAPFQSAVQKVLSQLAAPSVSVRCSAIRKIERLLGQFRHLEKERIAAFELLLLLLEHGEISQDCRVPANGATDGEEEAVAVLFNDANQLPAASFLQTANAALMGASSAALSAETSLSQTERIACRQAALDALLDGVENNVVSAAQFVEAMLARLAASGASSLPPSLERLLLSRLLKLAALNKLDAENAGGAALVLRTLLMRAFPFQPRLALVCVETACESLEETLQDEAKVSAEKETASRETALPPAVQTALTSALTFICSAKGGAASAALCPAFARLLTCARRSFAAETAEGVGRKTPARAQSQALIHLAFGSLFRVEDSAAFCGCFQVAAQQVCDASWGESSSASHRELRQALLDRLLWEACNRMQNNRDLTSDPWGLLFQLGEILALLKPANSVDPSASAALECSLFSWRCLCASLGSLLWHASNTAASEGEVRLLLRVVKALLALQPSLAASTEETEESSHASPPPSCKTRAEALRRCSLFSPLLFLLAPLVTLRQLAVGTGESADALAETEDALLDRVRCLLVMAAASASRADSNALATGTVAVEEEGKAFSLSACSDEGGCVLPRREALFAGWREGDALRRCGIGKAASATPLLLAAWGFARIDCGAARALLRLPSNAPLFDQDDESALLEEKKGGEVSVAPSALGLVLNRVEQQNLVNAQAAFSASPAALASGHMCLLISASLFSESFSLRQEALVAAAALASSCPGAALSLLPCLHFAASRFPTLPVVGALLALKRRRRGREASQPVRSNNNPTPPSNNTRNSDGGSQVLIPDSLVGRELAGLAESVPGSDQNDFCLTGVEGLQSACLRLYVLSACFCVASLAVHKTAVQPAFRALHDLLPLTDGTPSDFPSPLPLVQLEDSFLLREKGAPEALCGCVCSSVSQASPSGVCRHCGCCVSGCCWCQLSPCAETEFAHRQLRAFATALRPLPAERLLSPASRWFLLMVGLSRMASFKELPFSKLSALPPSASSSSVASSAFAPPFQLPSNPAPFHDLLLASALENLQRAAPEAMLEFLAGLQDLVARASGCEAEGQEALGEGDASLSAKASGIALRTLGFLCMRGFLEPQKISRILRRRCRRLFNFLRSSAASTAGLAVVLFSLALNLSEELLDLQRQVKSVSEGDDPAKQQELLQSLQQTEKSARDQLMLLEDLAGAGCPYTRALALWASASLVGPLYETTVETLASGRSPAAEENAARLACAEGIQVVASFTLEFEQLRPLAALLAAAISREHRLLRLTGPVGSGGSAALSSSTASGSRTSQQQRAELLKILTRRVAASQASAAAESFASALQERALLRLLVLTEPAAAKAAASAVNSSKLSRELKALRGFFLGEVSLAASHFQVSEAWTVPLLHPLCRQLVERFVAMLPSSACAEEQCLLLGRELLQMLGGIMPRLERDGERGGEEEPAAASGSCGSGSGPRLSEFALLLSVFAAVMQRQPQLTPALIDLFAARLRATRGGLASGQPPWLEGALLMVLAPVHSPSCDVSAFVGETPDLSAWLRAAREALFLGEEKTRAEADSLTGASEAAALTCAARCAFLAAHLQRHAGNKALLGLCFDGLADLLCAALAAPQEAALGLSVLEAASVAVASAVRTVHLRAVDPAAFQPALLRLYRHLEAAVLGAAGDRKERDAFSSSNSALLPLAALAAVLLEDGVLSLEEVCVLVERVENLVKDSLGGSFSLALTGAAYLAASLLPLALAARRKAEVAAPAAAHARASSLRLRFEKSLGQLHAAVEARVTEAAPASSERLQLFRGLAAAALCGSPNLLRPPTRAGVAWISPQSRDEFKLAFLPTLLPSEEESTTTGGGRALLAMALQASGVAAADFLTSVLTETPRRGDGEASTAGGAGRERRKGGGAEGDGGAASSLVLALLYIHLEGSRAEGSLRCLHERSVFRFVLQEVAELREGQPLPSWSFSLEDRVDASLVSAETRPTTAEGEKREALREGSFGEEGAGCSSSRLSLMHVASFFEALSFPCLPPLPDLRLESRFEYLFERAASDALRHRRAVRKLHAEQLAVPSSARRCVCVCQSSSCPCRSLLRQAKACVCLQSALLRFCARHSARLPSLSALVARWGVGLFRQGVPLQQQRQRQGLASQDALRMSLSLKFFFLAILPATAGRLPAPAMLHLLGTLFRRLLRGGAEATGARGARTELVCAAFESLRRILEATRRGVCCGNNNKDAVMRKQLRLDQSKREREEQEQQRQLPVEREEPVYVFESAFHKLEFFEQLSHLLLGVIVPRLSGGDALGEVGKVGEDEEEASCAVKAAVEIPSSVACHAAEALSAFFVLRNDCRQIRRVLKLDGREGDLFNGQGSEPTQQSAGRGGDDQAAEEEDLKLVTLPSLVLASLVRGGVLSLSVLQRKRLWLLGSCRNADAETEARFLVEVVRLAYGISWLSPEAQLEALEGFACGASASLGGNADAASETAPPPSEERAAIGFAALAAFAATPSLPPLFLEDLLENHERGKAAGEEEEEAEEDGVQDICEELFCFPDFARDGEETSGDFRTQVQEPQCMYTSQAGIKRLLLLAHARKCKGECCGGRREACRAALSIQQAVVGAPDFRRFLAGSEFSEGELRFVSEHLLLLPAAFRGTRAFFCLNWLPNLFSLKSLYPTPAALSGVNKASERGGEEEGKKAQRAESGEAAANRVISEEAQRQRMLRRRVYGDEEHERILLERREDVLLQHHLPEALLAGAAEKSRASLAANSHALFLMASASAPVALRALQNNDQTKTDPRVWQRLQQLPQGLLRALQSTRRRLEALSLL